ncbi:MAG: pseudouridine synthase [Planctomycetota bacterium]|nr:pseudouridine synthase [Planctomycetota bacterium]MDI6787048.1 pseudouridine synthase [Planctomycetota bacterium]
MRKTMTNIRLHKFLAHCGVASRRHSEELISAGKIIVNNQCIREQGFLIDPQKDKVYYNGKLLKIPQEKVYFIVNKPKGYVCTNASYNEPRVIDLIKTHHRLYTIGRLDKDSEGLIIVTNDGELCQKVSHPSFQVPKTYFVVVRGYVDGPVFERIQKGIWLSEGKLSRSKIRIVKRDREQTTLLITLKEGKKREVRRIFARFSYPVKYLKRIQIGNLHLGNLRAGEYRQISCGELSDKLFPLDSSRESMVQEV